MLAGERFVEGLGVDVDAPGLAVDDDADEIGGRRGEVSARDVAVELAAHADRIGAGVVELEQAFAADALVAVGEIEGEGERAFVAGGNGRGAARSRSTRGRRGAKGNAEGRTFGRDGMRGRRRLFRIGLSPAARREGVSRADEREGGEPIHRRQGRGSRRGGSRFRDSASWPKRRR